MLYLMQSLHGSASCPGTVWWTVIFSPAASSRQSPCAGLLAAVQQVNGQWPGLPSCSIMSFIISSSKSSWYCPGFLHMQVLHSVSYPTPLGCQIMHRAGKWDAQVPQLGSIGTKRLCRSEVASFRCHPSTITEILVWPCGDVHQKLWHQLSAYLFTENN